jgi:hypothetical protein
MHAGSWIQSEYHGEKQHFNSLNDHWTLTFSVPLYLKYYSFIESQIRICLWQKTDHMMHHFCPLVIICLWDTSEGLRMTLSSNELETWLHHRRVNVKAIQFWYTSQHAGLICSLLLLSCNLTEEVWPSVGAGVNSKFSASKREVVSSCYGKCGCFCHSERHH